MRTLGNSVNAFLEDQYAKGMELADSSDRVDLTALGTSPAARAYLAKFNCKGLVRRGGKIVVWDNYVAGIRFEDDYLGRFDAARVLSFLYPHDVFHPNIRPPYICAGHLQPGTPLIDLLYQLYEIIIYHNVTMREEDALNPEACSWARRHVGRFPLDRRPLRRPLVRQEG